MGQSNFKPRHKRTSVGRTHNPRQKIDNMYDSAWEKYRLRFLAANPECYACGKRATEVDHVKRHNGDAYLFTKLDNHIPLCMSCHSTVTTKFDRYSRPVEEKIKWLNDRRIPTDTWTPRLVKVLSSYD